MLLIWIIILICILTLAYLYDEGHKLSYSGKKYCEDYVSDKYECPYGQNTCETTNFSDYIVCPLNTALFDKKVSIDYILENPNNLFNPIYFIKKKTKVPFNIEYSADLTKFRFNEYTINIDLQREDLIGVTRDPIKNEWCTYITSEFLVDYLVSLSLSPQTNVDKKAFFGKLDEMNANKNKSLTENGLGSLKNTTEKQRNDKKYQNTMLFYPFQQGLKASINIIASSFIPKLNNTLSFDYRAYLLNKVQNEELLTIFEVIFFIGYNISDLDLSLIHI
jgi:hypothetical protein